MRARQRHFNPKSAAAIVALDSRFIPPQADGSGLSSWPDRLGGTRANNFSQGTAANQPAYTLNAINGNPAVRFANKFMSTATSFGSNNSISGNPAITIVSVHNKTSATNGSFVGWGDVFNALAACGVLDDNASFVGFAFGGTNIARMTVFATSQNFITVVKKPAGAINLSSRFRNGINVASGTPSSSTPNINGNQACIIGAWANYNLNTLYGDIAYIVIFNIELTNAMQKKLQNSAAFSFKLACS